MPCVNGAARTDKGPGRRPLLLGIMRTLLTPACLVVLYLLLPLDREFSAGTLAALGAGVLAMGLLVGWQVRSILRSPHPALRAVEAVALSLPLFLLLFAATYTLLSDSDPGAFTEPLSPFDSLYFVVTVFATVGFGDITAVSTLARVLVTVQMVGDLVLIGLVLRVFLTAVDRGRRRAAEQVDTPSPGRGSTGALTRRAAGPSLGRTRRR
jgi:voltage-gated potassium channel